MADGTLNRSGNPLHAIQRGSHVCQNWRNVLLNSPSLWAQCINLDSLRRATDTWRDIVFHRTGSSLLTITGHGLSGNSAKDLVWYFLDILEDHWHRIRNVNVVLNLQESSISESYVNRMWQVLIRPTDTLRLFALDIQQAPLLPHPSTIPLFSHRAPSLGALSLNVPQLQFPITIAAPLHSLRTLHLSYERRNLSNVELLNMCMQMPMIEKLTLCLQTIATSFTHLRPILRNLKFIDIKCDELDIYPAFLERITPHPRCHLRLLNQIFDWSHLPEYARANRVDDAWRIIRRYLDALFFHRVAELPDVRIKVSLSTILFTSSDPYPFELSWKIGSNTLNSRMVLEAIFCCLSTINYPRNIKQLEFLLDLPLSSLPNPDHLLGLLHSMSSITTLVANHICLISLKDLIAKHKLLPCLETVVFHGNGNYINGRIVDIIPFLVHRHRTVPVRRLDLTASSHQFNDDHRVIDSLRGLELVWFPEMPGRKETYICGSGGHGSRNF